MAIAIGFKTNTHVFILGETTVSESIIKIKENENRITKLDNVLFYTTGKHTDEIRLRSYITEYSKLISLEYDIPLTPRIVSEFVGTRLHESLRSSFCGCNTIVAGIDKEGTDLYCIDQYGARHRDSFVVIGYGLYFLYGLFDYYYNKDMNKEESLVLLKLCIKTLKEKMIIETDHWDLTILSKDNYENIKGFNIDF